MSILVNITAPALENNEVHTNTTIEISEISDFSTLYLTVEELSDKLSITIDDELVNGNTYYVRARFTFTPGGNQGYSNPVSFIADNSIENKVRLNPPVLAMTPTLEIETFNVFKVPLKFFNIRLNTPSALVGKIASVSWVIEDLENNVYYASINDRENTNKLYVDMLLDSNKVYTAKAAIRTSTGNMSEYANVVFKTTRTEDEYRILSTIVNSQNRVIAVTVATGPLYLNSTVIIYNKDGNSESYTLVGPTLDVEALTSNGTSVIAVENNNSDGTTNNTQYTYQDFQISEECTNFPYAFPYKFCYTDDN